MKFENGIGNEHMFVSVCISLRRVYRRQMLTVFDIFEGLLCFPENKSTNRIDIADSMKVAFGNWQFGIGHLGIPNNAMDLPEGPPNNSYQVPNSQCPKHPLLKQLYIHCQI